MSSAISRHDQASRSWWSSKHAKYPAQPKDMPQDFTPGSSTSSTKSSGSKFNSLTSVFKSKKHPSLAIQDPPLPPARPVLSAVSPSDLGRSKSHNVQCTRPPSKSVSSTLSQAESSEPRTPVDSNREMHHQSLLTLSDNDPFASHGIFIPHSPVDPNRLSVYSNSSIIEYSKRSDAGINRGSYASSSSQSNYYGDSPSFSPTSRTASSPDIPTRRKLTSKKSGGDLRRNGSMHSSVVSAEVIRNARDAAWESLPSPGNPIIKNSSSVTLTEKNRLSQPDASHVARPSLRARGLTESGGIHPPNFLRRDSAQSPDNASTSSPRVIVRQASIQRMGLPPSAPPTQRLPLPPPVPMPIVDDDADVVLSPDISGGSAASSFTSSMREPYMANQHYIPREDRSHRDTSSELEKSPLSSPKAGRTLKKSISHQSLTKRGSSGGSPAPPTATTDPVVEKAPRKQRSFHHARLPMIPPLPLPLRHNNNSVPSTAASNSAGDATSISDKRGSSGGGSASGGRKRLFSGSHFGRHSASQGLSPEEDKRSVFSLPVESDRTGSSSLLSQTTLSPSSSFWDESTPDIPSSPKPEYVPQSILSPAELLEVEANIQDALNFSKQSRQRGYSVVSSSTVADDDYGPIPEGLAAPFSLNNGPKLGISVPSLYSRPSTQPTHPSSITSNSFFSPPSDPHHISLPPPPRRSRPQTSPAHNDNEIKPLSPPPRTKVRRKVSVETNLRRNMMIRKPSFLDIDDEFDRDHQRVSRPDPPPKVNAKQQIHDSFLDLARESFDSSRSDDP
ncbi:uncharacterized protein EV420DRAFT_1511700 [Desarmillaria tabescens]|uniref:Uncharacterized protein n=1 Tax=Armillaria tabescens TaxID=1929756 RepID=A0AA39TY29_ARMTA|nr:uncharacterized protein EV420DRAFT_1511700 [Desarmillaria tabescens]KAK0466454.1 hypothetical protein EV420DRAFT_1511700 [Desarmillaria tabescens]